MRFLGMFFAVGCLVAVGAMVAWEQFTLERIGGTSREVRFLGFGTEPSVCMRRLRKNFHIIEPSMDAIVDAMNEAPVMDSSIYYPDLDRLLLELETTELSDRDTRIKAAWVALHGTENAYRPWQFYRAFDGSVRADTLITCGHSTASWVRLFFPSVATSPKEGDILARLTFVVGKPSQDWPPCGLTKPELNDDFFATCVTRLNERWFVQQDWEDRCSALNAKGWSFFQDPDDSEEERAYLEGLIAEGVTPCEATLQGRFFG